jgi:hypothetical protein
MGLGLALALAALLAPAHAAAVDSDLKHAFAFQVEASNGYSILTLAANDQADGTGEVLVVVARKHATVLYVAPAQLTATSVEADLGALGGISLEVTPSGREKSIRPRCDEESKTVSFEPQRYSGNFEFHGEEGYTEATTSAPSERTRFLYEIGCRTTGSSQVSGDDIPGAGLSLHSGRRGLGLNLEANKNGPSKRAHLQVRLAEEHAGIVIIRQMSQWAGADAFDYDPLLDTAVLAPPAPFSGSASFRRGAAAGNRWSGNLSVDLPGHLSVPLAGPGVKATLVPGCWAEGSRGPRC